MPKNKIIKKEKNDKFYTKPELAKQCLNFLLSKVIEKECVYIEPSAGNGSFSNLIDCVALDIKPESEGIVRANWLSFNCKKYKNFVVFGNPPFGSRNNLSNQFIKKSVNSGALYVGFVLPNSYKKYTTQKVFPENWKLVGCMDLPQDSFLLQGNSYHVPCVFQVWTKSELHNENFRDVKGKEYTQDFSFVSKNDDADFFIFGAAPSKIIQISEIHPNNRGYYVKSNIGEEELKNKLKQVKWSNHANSSVNGGVAWFTKSEIIKIYEKKHDNQ